MIRSRLVVVLTVLLAACAAACGQGGAERDDSAVVHAEGAGRLPADTVEDWVSYADAVVVATVTSERVNPLTTGQLNASGEGVEARLLSLRVDKQVWSRAGARPVPEELVIESGGWAIKSFTERRRFTVGPVRLEVGSAYLLPLAWYPKGPFDAAEHFGHLGSDAIALIGPDGRPTSDEPVNGDALRGFMGRSPDEIGAVLRGASPDPVAAKHFDLDPVPRYCAVLKARGLTCGASTAQ